ncbi:MAG: sigma-70 family RNA polymerase sigma factor [Cyanobacteriota bacterium]|nr:sigma-70 family RNA polymerase sigma factor [Cyanobacteriota bacterium]
MSTKNLTPRKRFDEAFRALVTPENPDAYSIFTFVRQRLRQFNLYNDDPHLILNEVYLRGRKLIGSGTVIHNPLGWIRITSLNVIRERARDRSKIKDYARCVELIPSPDRLNLNREDVGIDSLNYTALKWALSQLDPNDLKILELRYGDCDLSWQEIGKKLAFDSMCPINTATLRQKGFRALKRLRKLFHSYLEELNVSIS